MKSKAEISPKNAMRTAIIAQNFGILGMNAFNNGIILLYMTVLGLSPARILVYLSLPTGLSILLRLPVANLADRWGKKRVGFIGLVLTVIGFAAFPIAGLLSLDTAEKIMIVGIIFLSAGKMLFASSWLALLDGFVPEGSRGRFFGKARMIYAITGIIFAGLCALWLGKDSPVSHYIVVMLFLTFCFLMRAIYYLKIPEIKRPGEKGTDFSSAFKEIIQAGNFTSFCSYVFLLTLFSAGCPSIFSMMEKKVMVLGDNIVILLTILSTLGSVAGFFIGGKLIDRFGTKYAFLLGHITLSLCIFGFVVRNLLFFPTIWNIAIIHLIFGIIIAILGLAISTEMLALIPKTNKSLATSVCMTFQLGAQSLSGILSAWALDIGMLNRSWQLFGTTMTAYDSILLLFACMVLLLVVTLSLVPSVIRKANWGPIPQ